MTFVPAKKPLSAKQKKYYSKLISKKLVELGVRDDVIMKGTAKTKTVQYFDQQDNQVKAAKQQIGRLSNPHRNILKKLLDLSVEEVERFLTTEFPKAQQPAEQAPTEAPNEVQG